MRQLLLGLGQFVVSIGDGIKTLFQEPECKVCKAKQEIINFLMEELSKTQMREVEYRGKLFRILRLEEQPSQAQTSNHNIRIKGIVSPMKQRADAERKSREEHWRALANEAASLPNISETKDAS